MRKHNGSRALLTELIVVVLIFMLCASVLIRLFSYSAGLGHTAGARDAALNAAQNAAERIAASSDPAAALTELGYGEENGSWFLETEGCRLEVSLTEEPREAGTMLVYTVTALKDVETLFTLPGKTYRGEPDA